MGGTNRTDVTAGRIVPMYKEKEESSSSSSSIPNQEEEVSRVHEAMEAAGIGRNMWPKLAALEWMTAEYVAAHAAAARKRGEPINFVIQRLRSGDQVPQSKTAGCSEHGAVYWSDGICLVCSGSIVV